MSDFNATQTSRRDFLKRAVALSAAVPLASLFTDAPAAFAASTGAPLAGSASTYRALARDEAAFTEAMVNALCPADRMTPDGVTCGLAKAVDGLLAGEFGAEASASRGMTQAQFYRAGVAAVNDATRARFGARFDQLHPSAAGIMLADIANGRVTDARLPLDVWSRRLVDQLLVKACYSGRIYEGYSNKVYWKVFAQA